MTTTLANDVLTTLGLRAVSSGASTGTWLPTKGAELASINPATGEILGRVAQATADDYERVIAAAEKAFTTWRMMPAPVRGEVVSSARR
jgi:aldehyde dehydrogenase (NAD+)